MAGRSPVILQAMGAVGVVTDPRRRAASGKMPPMQILALETSTDSGSCALWLDGQLIERQCPPGRPHSETLLPLVRELLAEAGRKISQLDAIAFGVGPGAFTGLRVACGAAQGLAVAADVPLIQVTSLENLAAQTGKSRVLALLDARMGEVYAGYYQAARDNYALLGEIRVAAPQAIEFPDGADWFAVGNAITAYPALAERLAAAGVESLLGVMPTAASVARIAAQRGGGIDPADAAPLYIRDKVAKTVAERLREGGKA